MMSPAMRGRELKRRKLRNALVREQSPAMRGRELKHMPMLQIAGAVRSPAMRGRELKQQDRMVSSRHEVARHARA